ncbi:MAG TPA: type 1 glutamine amidotransferase [Acidimicrobiales bacterium]|nr:type 1 glutamine amidotransferase [Acidimicrobiales bacterium]
MTGGGLRAGHARLVALLCGRSPAERYSVHRGYVDAICAVGAQPVLVPSGEGANLENALELVAKCDAVVLTGGNDVDPALYGFQRGVGEKDIDPQRDRVEMAALELSHEAGRPVLGICRGIQVMAVAAGGTLVADLPAAGFAGHEQEASEGEAVHGVVADTGSHALRALAGATGVNSLHHQAVAEPGPTLRASAWSPDGVIEAIEAPGLLGLQWHPERMFKAYPRHLAAFRWLVQS